MLRVFDTSAIVAFLRDEPGADKVRGLLAREAGGCIAHAINLCEVFYRSLRANALQERDANLSLLELERFGLRTSTEMSPGFWREAGRIKARVQHLSLGDAFCAALAARYAGQVVTADSGFRALVQAGICRVAIIR